MNKLPEPDEVDFFVGGGEVPPRIAAETAAWINEYKSRPGYRLELDEAKRILDRLGMKSCVPGEQGAGSLYGSAIESRLCTIVLQFNSSRNLELTLGSVWLFNGNGVPFLEQLDMETPPPGWAKVVGPIDYEIASSIHSSLKSFFEQSGVTVIDEGIAD